MQSSDLPEDSLVFKDETYRLFGISSFMMERKHLTTFRFDTCFHGHYYEIFYVFLRIKENKPKVVAHTLPEFFPMDKWEKEYLSIDMQSFTQCVSLHLNSFIARREQVNQLKASHPRKVEIVTSEDYCTVDMNFEDFTIRLNYKQDERYPYNVDLKVVSKDKTFPKEKKIKAGINEEILDMFHSEDLVTVVTLLQSLYVCFIFHFIFQQTHK